MAVFDTSKYQDASPEEHRVASADYHYAYVDNMGVLAARTETVADALSEAKSVFESHGLVLHELEVCSVGAETLGVAVGSRGLFTAPTMKRLRVLRRRLGAFLSLSWCTGDVVEVLIGHCTYAALTCRLL